jgi:hypothetical protein
MLSDCVLISELFSLKGSGRKWSLENLRCYADICREGLTKPRETSDQQISGPKFEPGIRCRRLDASIFKAEHRNMTGLSIVFHFSSFCMVECRNVTGLSIVFHFSPFCMVECRNMTGLSFVFHFFFFLYGRMEYQLFYIFPSFYTVECRNMTGIFSFSSFCMVECRNMTGLSVVFHSFFFPLIRF